MVINYQLRGFRLTKASFDRLLTTERIFAENPY